MFLETIQLIVIAICYRCALEATDSEARANEQFIIAEERRAGWYSKSFY